MISEATKVVFVSLLRLLPPLCLSPTSLEGARLSVALYFFQWRFSLDDLACDKRIQLCAHLRYQRQQTFEPIVGSDQHNYGDFGVGQILLKAEILVSGHEHVELSACHLHFALARRFLCPPNPF